MIVENASKWFPAYPGLESNHCWYDSQAGLKSLLATGVFVQELGSFSAWWMQASWVHYKSSLCWNVRSFLRHYRQAHLDFMNPRTRTTWDQLGPLKGLVWYPTLGLAWPSSKLGKLVKSLTSVWAQAFSLNEPWANRQPVSKLTCNLAFEGLNDQPGDLKVDKWVDEKIPKSGSLKHLFVRRPTFLISAFLGGGGGQRRVFWRLFWHRIVLQL